MIDANRILFLAASLIIIATPGQDMILVLGQAFAALTFLIKGPVAVFAGRLSSWFQSRPHALAGLYRCSGAVMVTLAVRPVVSRRNDA